MNMDTMQPQTGVLWAGSKLPEFSQEPDTPPIYHSTAYALRDLDDYDRANHKNEGYFYSRTANPTRDSLAEAISYLEKGQATLICSSGMAAISSVLMTLLSKGDHAVVNRGIYGETIELMDQILSRFGIEVSYVDFTDSEQIRRAIRPNTRILYTEVITNPLIEVMDIDAIAEISRENNKLLVVDSTFTTPFVIRPLEHGADLVIHSLTKFFNGHSDVTAGSVTGSQMLIRQIHASQLLLGGCADANSSWLALRAIRTMDLRMKAHLDNASALAAALQKHPHVRYVNHPSLPDHPQHALAGKLFLQGYGPMLSFRVEDDRDKVNEFIRRLKFIQYLGTLGGCRTSLAHPATAFRFEFSADKLKEMGLHEGLIRLSAGIEDSRDIIGDLEQALEVFW